VPATVIRSRRPHSLGVIVGRSFDIAVPVRAQPVIMSSTPYPDDGPWLRVMLRLKRGQSLQEGDHRHSSRAAGHSRRIHPQGRRRRRHVPEAAVQTRFRWPRRSSLSGSVRTPLFALLAVVGLVL
jgi:hypothetical protein